MSITLTTPIQVRDLQGNIVSEITQVVVGEVGLSQDNQTANADILDMQTLNKVGSLTINAPSNINAIKVQIENYAISRGMIVGTRDVK